SARDAMNDCLSIGKSEIRISKSETNPKFEIRNSKTEMAPLFRISDFEIVSDFEIRISDFCFGLLSSAARDSRARLFEHLGQIREKLSGEAALIEAQRLPPQRRGIEVALARFERFHRVRQAIGRLFIEPEAGRFALRGRHGERAAKRD